MTDATDRDLIREYARARSEAAFAAIVRRYVNLVYSVAFRFTGNAGDAQDVTQAVFLILAQKAGTLGHVSGLSSWLYETTRFTATRFLRTQIRRHRREQEAFMQSTLNESDPAGVWEQLAPQLEAAMARLSGPDRALMVLRYYENKTGAEAAALLGIGEAAAHKRTARALEKLRNFFQRRGLKLTTAALAAALAAHSVSAAPVGLSATIVTATASGAAASSTLTLISGALKLMAWTKVKTTVAAGVVILLAAGTTTVIVRQVAAPRPKISGGDLAAQIRRANLNRPEAQVQAKIILFTAISQKRVPDAASWCATLNGGNKIWPADAPGTAFALNAKVAGRSFASGLAPNTVIFFETATTGWDQTGGPELLAQKPEGVAVAFADGRALLVPPEQVAQLRWEP